MKRILLLMCIIPASLTLFAGCRHTVLSRIGPPEEIFLTPSIPYDAAARVGVYEFIDPAYAPRTGMAAARFLYEELRRHHIFHDISLETIRDDFRTERLVAHGRQQGYDIIIIGEITYYLDGSDFQQSRVREEIGVIALAPGETVTLWHAIAEETAGPIPARDLLVYKKKGRPAPPATSLLRLNALKFCRMLAETPRH